MLQEVPRRIAQEERWPGRRPSGGATPAEPPAHIRAERTTERVHRAEDHVPRCATVSGQPQETGPEGELGRDSLNVVEKAPKTAWSVNAVVPSTLFRSCAAVGSITSSLALYVT